MGEQKCSKNQNFEFPEGGKGASHVGPGERLF